MAKKKQGGTILVGESDDVFAFYSRLKHPEGVLGAFCSEGVEMPEGLQRLGDYDAASAFIEENTQVVRVYCDIYDMDLEYVRSVQYACKARAVKFCLVVPIVNELDTEFVSMRRGGNVLLTPKGEPLTKLHNRVMKRAFDLFFVLLFMLTFFPIIYLLKSFFIKRKKRGSSFSYKFCVGPNGRVFNRVSFRGKGNSVANVFNVLKGNMSLVGPECYELEEPSDVDKLPTRLLRREVKAGMNGWARVKKADAENRLDADIYYVEHWTLWFDFRILFRSMF
ncbi:MAG: sugar transferase [Bacteroidaceae bacterium]|nr:sugar transferase [Bacteroidaceae bacterium]